MKNTPGERNVVAVENYAREKGFSSNEVIEMIREGKLAGFIKEEKWYVEIRQETERTTGFEISHLKTRLGCDIAYGCFLFCGMQSSIFILAALIDVYSDLGAIDFMIFTYFFSLFAAVLGIGLTIGHYKHWPLIVLSNLTVLFFLVPFLVVSRYDRKIDDYEIFIACIFYSVSTCGLSLPWFLCFRRREERRSKGPYIK